MTSRIRATSLTLAAVLCAAALWPADASAQRRGRPGGGRTVIVAAPAFGYGFYDPFWNGWGPGWGMGWGPGWGYPGWFGPWGTPFGAFGSARLQVTPRQAEVYVDGYLAGTVDDFDGVFQRLRLRPGGHEITVFLEGYETVREAIYLEPGAERKLQFAMNRLAAGERSQPPPAPAADEESPARTLPDAPGARDAGNEGDVRERRETNLRFGTLVLRVQPPDAEILIDNERWATSASQDRLSIELPQGRHSVEVRRQGSSTFREDVLIRPGATLTLNVSLK